MSPAAPSLAQPDGSPAARASILAVDDQPANLLALEALLADLGHPLVKAASGDDALRWLLDNDPAVILMDVRMPGLDGYETARLIRGRDRSRHTPIIFVTAHETPDASVHQALREGAADFLVKPLVPDVLRAKVASYVELYRKAESGLHRERQELERRLAEAERRESEVRRQQLTAEEALKDSDRRKDELLAMLAHELRNPLAPIRNALHTLQLPGAPAADAEAARQVMGRQVEHLARLVEDLLDVSRLQRGRIRLRKEPVELAEVIARAAEAVRSAFDARRQEFTIALPPEPVLLEADAARLTQVLVNLLDNAAKYTEEGGRVWLTAKRNHGEVFLRVRDTGMGIPAELLPYVFDLFSQGERSLDRSQGGLGLGLTLVRRLLEMHGGSVAAFSDGPGRGSEFVVRLPLPSAAHPASTPASLAAPPAGLRPIHRTLKVLVVDDNVDGAVSLGIVLRLWGHEVQVAHDGWKALEDACGRRFDVVVLDIGLPGLDGYEVARRLRKRTGWEKVFLIAMTGYGQNDDRRRSQEAGFDLHFVKPVDPAVLEKVLRDKAGPADVPPP
jgi:signal transduction histidine kinase